MNSKCAEMTALLNVLRSKYNNLSTVARSCGSFGYNVESGAYLLHKYCIIALLSHNTKPSSSIVGTVQWGLI